MENNLIENNRIWVKSKPCVFLDANILFSAIISPQGLPRKILLLSANGTINAVISHQVIDEVERNLSRKFPALIKPFFLLIENVITEIVENADQETIEEVIGYLDYQPDATVLATALNSNADYFITGDKKHFLSNLKVRKHANIIVLSPRDFLNLLQDK